MKANVWLLILLLVAGIGSAPVGGHHAFSANYDVDTIGTIEGIVVEVFWANPHVHYYLDVDKEDGGAELWDIESSNLNGMATAGWTKDTIKIGDRIRVSGGLGRDGKRRLALDKDSLEMLK